MVLQQQLSQLLHVLHTQLPICCMNSHGSLMWRSLPPLKYTFWCSGNTPELLVVALHQALLLAQVFAFSSFITSYSFS